jgi:thioredoxin 2
VDETANAPASAAMTVPCPFCGTRNRVRAARVDDRPKVGTCARPLLLDRPVKADDASFDAVLGGTDVPVLVDFFADWCGPCRMLAPSLDAIAHERRGRLLVLKVDTDASPALSQRFAIRSIPLVVLFDGGREIARQAGALPKPQLDAWLDRATGGAGASG